MKKIPKINWEGETYYYLNDTIVDQYFIEVPLVTKRKVGMYFFSKCDYTKFELPTLIRFIKKMKKLELYELALESSSFAFSRYKNVDNVIFTLLPIITSSYRNIGKSNKAIKVYEKYNKISSRYISLACLTSVAAAYCDLGEYEKAKRCANRAYARQGGDRGYKTELNFVYERIDNATRANFKYRQ